MKLKILTALLLAIGLTLVACGGGNNAPATGGENKGGECAPANDSAENSGDTGEEAPAKAMVYEIGIDGMTWGNGWVNAAKSALMRLEGVETVDVSFMDKKATIKMKEGVELTEDMAKQAVAEASDERGNNFSLTSFKKTQ